MKNSAQIGLARAYFSLDVWPAAAFDSPDGLGNCGLAEQEGGRGRRPSFPVPSSPARPECWSSAPPMQAGCKSNAPRMRPNAE